MKSGVSFIIGGLLGGAIGAAVTYIYMSKVMEEEIAVGLQEIRDSYDLSIPKNIENPSPVIPEDPESPDILDDTQKAIDIVKVHGNYSKTPNTMTNYSNSSTEKEIINVSIKDKSSGYPINEDEYADNPEYEACEWTLYSDEIMTDDYDEIVASARVETVIGATIDDIAEEKESALCYRNDELKMDVRVSFIEQRFYDDNDDAE